MLGHHSMISTAENEQWKNRQRTYTLSKFRAYLTCADWRQFSFVTPQLRLFIWNTKAARIGIPESQLASEDSSRPKFLFRSVEYGAVDVIQKT
ncbi:hypothetical protein FE257_001807 [Aspergillus nanangensis]|uniref:Uncharacterized protein n=1 Tax=Aspergillus nanangensis TaxID=2582783 RepID=A0AAD4CDR0_ASPNN|nr:hypothetical protein FE257_001807 [Aspergillus nanangensis]